MKCVTAKKRHRCNECGREIKAGERYWMEHEDKGDSRNWKEHCNCAEAESMGAQKLPEDFYLNRSKYGN